jgi:hypothetical protein
MKNAPPLWLFVIAGVVAGVTWFGLDRLFG